MKKNLQRFGASVLAAAMVAQSVALPAAAETTKIDSSVAQSVAASAASAASAVQSLPKFTSTADLIKQTAQTLAAQGEVHELEQDDAKLEATAQSKAGMSLAALENALADAMYANAAAGKINTEAYGLNKDEMASVMAATIKTYHLSSAVTDLGYETNAAGVVTAVTFTGSSGMTSAMESMTNSDDEVIAQQADSYAQAYVAENSDTFAASAAADGHTYGEPKWYWNDTNPEDGHTHTWKETPDGYWTKTDDGWAYTAVYTCEKGDAYQKVEGTVTKDTTEAKPGVAGKTVYSASVPADKSPVKKEYKEPTTRTDDIAALPCQSHVVSKDADGNFVATFNWEMKKVEGELAADYSNAQLFYDSETGKISAGAPVTIDWECTSVTFKCAVCGEEIKTQPVMTMPVSVVVDQNNNSVYINVGGTPTLDTTSGGTGVTLVSAMKDGNWYDMQNNPVDASKVNFTYQSGDNKGKNSLLLYDSQKTAVYVDDQGNQVTNTYDVSTAQMNYYYFQLSQFNQDEAEYFGVAAPFWTSKGVQKQGEDGSITGTMGAIKAPGEICMTGPGVMLGYDRPEATAKALQVHADGKTWLHTGDIGYMSEDGVLYTMTRGASPRFGGGDLMVQPLENIVADADIKGIKDEFFVIVPDDEHEGCFLPYLYVQLKDGYTLDDVRDKINACLPERYMRPVEIFTVPERPFFHFKTNRIGLSKEIIAKRNQQKEKAKRNSFADGCIA